MELQACTVIIAAIISTYAVMGKWSCGTMTISSSSGDMMSNGYSLETASIDDNGNCITKLTITGKGVNSILKVPCEEPNFEMLTSSDNIVVLGDPEKNSVAAIIESPTLMKIIRKGKCTKRTYTTTNGKRKSTTSPIPDCAEVKKEISEILEKCRLYWEEWNKNFNAKMARTMSKSSTYTEDDSNNDSQNSDDDVDNASDTSPDSDLSGTGNVNIQQYGAPPGGWDQWGEQLGKDINRNVQESLAQSLPNNNKHKRHQH